MNPKIQNHHQTKPAYVYLRQSTMAQVRHHSESTERQYALKDKAAKLGWPSTRIRILDADLGVSGAQIAERVLEVLKPAQIEIALKALEELERQDQAIDRQRQMRLQRAEYEAQLRQRRYEEVDPSNRLVAATLERCWNGALENVEKLRQEYAERQASEALAVTPQQRARACELAHDLPRLWKASTTKAEDRNPHFSPRG
ncbi:MAG: hypothetical protein V1790_02440 [Planctomycetota bacterium]